MDRLEHIPISDHAVQQMSKSNIQMGLMGPVSAGASSQQISVSNNQSRLMGPNHVPQMIPTPNLRMAEMEKVFNGQLNEMQNLFNNAASQRSSILSKRKEPMETTSNMPQKLVMPNKRVAQAEHRPWLQQISPSNKPPVLAQSLSNMAGSQRLQPPPKRSVQSKTAPNPLVQRSQTGQMQPSPKARNESDSVRSKLRESLAAALALVSQQKNKPLGVEKNSQNDGASPPGQRRENFQAPGHLSGAVDTADSISKESKECVPNKRDSIVQNCTDDLNASQKTSNDQNAGVFAHEDVTFSDSFFVKDELLQGNGLSWVLELDTGVAQQKGVEADQKQLERQAIGGEKTVETPETLAFKIEVELFKFFGGVNKKYKEKGRSLLFNLKDRNNPELRERVISGEIPPEKLCSMTAEELASKELSEWRMAKAEEFAQMVVLPDSDVDVRRLVKKTHKGEFQVEVEEQDSFSVEVAVGASSLTRLPPKKKETSPPSKPNQANEKVNANGEKNNLEEQDAPYTLTIPSNEGTDLMQGFMVDDELKDAEFLPPIVSLDEFMESLNSEPPFENLPVDAEKTTPISEKDGSPIASDSKSSDVTLKEHVDNTSVSNKPEAIVVTRALLDADGKPIDGNAKSETIPSVGTPKGERVWEGLLQLNISSSASVVGIYKSGEKTSIKDWPGFIEIKGRVRLDAFEKFLQELRMSRSRAVMALHFVSKEGSSENERASICEVADSYVLDERVGFAEPAPGAELYFCPPHSNTREMLSKLLPKDQFSALNAVDNGLIGVVVWRKAQTTSTSSPHKHSSKKQQLSSRRHPEKDTNITVNMTARDPLPRGGHPSFHHTKPPPDEDDDDDVPPGFGPLVAGRDEDDLPEFNFSSSSIPPRSHPPTQSTTRVPGTTHLNPRTQNSSRDQMRELVHRYGQPKTNAPSGNIQDVRGIAVQPWNDDDDDDDMPEWHPDEARPHAHPPQLRGFQHPTTPRSHMMQQTAHQYAAPLGKTTVPLTHGHQQNAVPSLQQGPWMVPPSGSHVLPGQKSVGWRSDAPRSRGF